MRRAMLTLLALIGSLVVAAPAHAANACATTGDTCQIVVSQRTAVPWMVNVFTFSGDQRTDGQSCTEQGLCTFTVPYKAEVTISVQSTLPFIWAEAAGKLSGKSGVGQLTRALGMLSGPSAARLVVDSNLTYGLAPLSPVTFDQSAGRVSVSGRLSELGSSMQATPATPNPQSMSDSFGDCGIDSSVLPQAASAKSIGLVLALIDVNGQVVAQADENRSIYYGPAKKSNYANDRSFFGMFDLPTSIARGELLRLVATIDNQNGTCASRLGSITVSSFAVDSPPPLISADLLPALYADSGSYEYQLSADSVVGAATWISLGGPLPDGMAISRSGLVTATGVAPGTYNFTVVVQDSTGAISVPQTFEFTSLPYTLNRITATQFVQQRGCTAGGSRCYVGVETTDGNATEMTIDGRLCVAGSVCIEKELNRVGVTLRVSLPQASFVSAELVTFPAKSIGGKAKSVPVTPTFSNGEAVASVRTAQFDESADVLLRVVRKPALNVTQDPASGSLVLKASFSELAAAAPWVVNAVDQPSVPVCPTNALDLAQPGSPAPRAVAVFSDEPTLSLPFAVVPMKLIRSTSGSDPFDAVAVYANANDHANSAVYVGIQLHTADGAIACAPTSKTVQLITYPPIPTPVKVAHPTQIRTMVGRGLKTLITASGGTAPYTYTLAAGGLPKGLFLDTSGVLFGRPVAAGNYAFLVRATDASGRSAYSDVIELDVDWSVVTSDLPDSVTVGTPIDPISVQAIGWSSRMTTGDWSITYTAPGLPAGLRFDAANRLVSGTPSAAGNYMATFVATVSIGSDIIAKHIVVWPMTVLPAQTPKNDVFTAASPKPPTPEELAKLAPDQRKRVVPAPPTVEFDPAPRVKPTPAIAITADGGVVQVPPPVDVFASAASDAGTASASAATLGKNTVVPGATVGKSSTSTPATGTTTGGTTTGATTPATTKLTLTFTANKATVSAAARARFAAAIKAFGKVTSVTISAPVIAKNGKPTPASQAVAYLRTQVVKNQLKAAGAGSATVTAGVVAQKKANGTVTVTLTR